MSETIVYTDGSCLGNPGKGGWAAVIIKNNKFNKSYLIPKFDKSIDDRLPKSKWHHLQKKVDIFICVTHNYNLS